MDGEAVTNIINAARERHIEGWVVEPDEYEPGIRYFIVPDGARLEQIDMEKFSPNPRRAKGKIELRDVAGFCAYVNRHKGPDTALFADNQRVTAILNHHFPERENAESQAGWGDHVATLEFKFTPQWTAWTGLTGKLITQEAFAEFLEDNYLAVVEPDGATLLDIATNMRAKLDAEYDKALVLSSGQVRFTYNETLTASSATRGEIIIPEKIVLGLRCFEGGDVFRVPARLRWRLNSGKVHFMLVLGDEARQVFDESFEAALTAIFERTQVEVLRGRVAS